MAHTLQDFLVRLQNTKRRGTEYVACCPAHDDENPSLSVTEKDGKVLLKCHAGCSYESIIKALGLGTATPSQKPSRKTQGEVYIYENSAGQAVFEVVRYEPKSFSQRKIQPDGSRVPSMQGVERVLYKLPSVLQAVANGSPVYITEGEKDVHSLCSLSVVATTNPGGAGKWSRSFSDSLKGGIVTVVVDMDDPGKKHAALLRKELEPVCKSLRFVRAKAGKDASDHVAAGYGLDDFEPFEFESRGSKLMTLQELYALPLEEVKWTVDGLLPSGSLSILVAKPKVGKSSLIRELARDVALGERFLERTTHAGKVLYLAFEERPYSVKEAFEAMAVQPDTEILLTTSKETCPDIETLTKLVSDYGPSLVIIDTLIRFCQVQDLNDYVGVTRAMEPLAELARASGTSILVSHHGKKGETEDNGDSALGSTALFGMVDTLIRLRKDSQGRRIISTEQRYGSPMESTVIGMDCITKRIWLKGSLDEGRMSSLRERILGLFKGTPMALAEIREKIKDNRVPEVVRQLVEEGILRQTGAGKKGDPYFLVLV